jgi:hypothetical protein
MQQMKRRIILRTVLSLGLLCIHAGCSEAEEPADPLGPATDAGLDADVAPVTTGSWTRPGANVTWQWQLDGTINTGYAVDLYDVDLFDVTDAVLESLHRRGVRVMCYFSAGTYEPGRPDAQSIPESARGLRLPDWPDERWLDVRDGRVFEVMRARLDLAVRRGCDAVEPDNVDGYHNKTGFALSAAQQLAFNRNLANEAHLRGLGVALKNDGEQASLLVDYYDLLLNEECHEYDECDTLRPFLERNKPVLNAEYAENSAVARRRADAICAQSRARGLRTLILPYDLDDAFRIPCF